MLLAYFIPFIGQCSEELLKLSSILEEQQQDRKQHKVILMELV